MSFGSASMLTSRVTCSSTPPSMVPGASSPPTSSSATTAWMATLRFTRRKSTCIVCPRTGWRWASLSTAGVAVAAELELDHGAASGERVAQLALVDGERHARRRRRRRGRRAPGPGGAGGGWSASWRPRARRWRVWWTDWPWAATDGSDKALAGRRQAPAAAAGATGARRPRPRPRGSPRAGRRRPGWRRSRASRPPTASPSRRPARAACAERSGSDGIECSHSRTRASSTPCARAASRMVSSSAAVPFVQPA